MNRIAFRGAAIAALLASPGMVLAQEAAVVPAAATTPTAVAPSVAAPAVAPAILQLPANTPITLSVNSEVNSRHMRVGDTFPLTVVQDITFEGHVVIPQGTRAIGEIVWRTGKGVFGKSAKMEVALRYLDMAGRHIPLRGDFRQEGEGNTGATIGAVIGVGLVGGLFVTGRSAVIPAGRELQAVTIDAIPITPSQDGGRLASIDGSYIPSAVLTGRPEQPGARARR